MALTHCVTYQIIAYKFGAQYLLRCLPPHKEEKTFQLWISKFTLTEQGQSLNILVHKQFEFTCIHAITKWVLRICSLSKSLYFDKNCPLSLSLHRSLKSQLMRTFKTCDHK